MTFTANRNRKPRKLQLLILLAAMVLVAVIVWGVVLPEIWFSSYQPREGDVLFQSLPRSSLSIAIENSTDSPWSHCGIVAKDDGQWVVYEAYGSVQRVTLREFWQRSWRHRFAAYRWREDDQVHVSRVLDRVKEYVGLPYDSRYEMDDQKIYCSELIFKAYHKTTGKPLGELVRLGDLRWHAHKALIERLEGGPVPVDRMMITPRDLAKAPELLLVQSYGVD